MPSFTPKYKMSMSPTEMVSPTLTVASTASVTPAALISERNSAVMGAPPIRSQWMCPPAKRISWYISAPGRLVTSMPKAMGTSSSGSNFFTMPRYSSTQAMTIMMRHFQLPPCVNW